MKDYNWKELSILNLKPHLGNSLEGFWIDIESQKLTKIKHVDWSSPWHHVNPDPARIVCSKLQSVFDKLRFIPKFCRECWKVCVEPRTLRELYELRDLQLAMVKDDPECWCKCGVERRMFTPGKIYGGYFYANSKEAGLERWHQVRKNVDPGIKVTLKRGCTEFEIGSGDPEKYERPAQSDDQEFMFYEMMEMQPMVTKQPWWSLLEIHQVWIAYGWRYGTPEDRRQIEEDHNHGEPLYSACRTYHPED